MVRAERMGPTGSDVVGVEHSEEASDPLHDLFVHHVGLREATLRAGLRVVVDLDDEGG